MIYVLNGDETYRMAIRKKELLQKDGLLEDDIVHFDFENVQPLTPVILACNTMSLFSEQRAIVVENPFFLDPKGKSSAKKNVHEDRLEVLESYLKNPNPETDLIFYCYGFKMDSRKKESKLLKKYDGKTVRILNFMNPTPYELDHLLDSELQKNHLRMDRATKEEFRLRINDSATELYRGIEKLVLYGESNVTIEEVEHLIAINPEVNIWKFQDAFLARDANKTYRSIYEMIEISNMSVQGLIPLLAFRLKQVFMVVRCKECGLSFQEIKTATKRYYPDKDYKSAHGRSSRELLSMIDDLATIDQGIKSGNLDAKASLDYYLLKHLYKRGL